MPNETRIVSPGPRDMTVRTEDGQILPIPPGWELLPPGDAGLTRRVKASGPTWTVQVKRGRKLFSRGIWAAAEQIAACRRSVERARATPEYARKLAGDRARRARAQEDYVVDFTRHVQAFLDFHPTHGELGQALARRVAEHATPVGSGTVARTSRIPVAERAEAAVIAWLRHQTTAYDHMQIPRVKGMRREVRRKLARRSRELLERYRRGESAAEDCPLAKALASEPSPPAKPAARAASPKPAVRATSSRPAAQARSPKPAARAASPKPAGSPRPEPATTPVTASPDEDPRAAKQRAVRERMARRGRR